ncbi:MAG TPA: hotdog domain-containing protein [Rectinemataceae bacterium]|nr:hotdog domain-containing protein [Rectinemataceae bacterium]
MLKETRTTRLVKSQDLNHHGTLFAGRIAEWFTESCFLSAARYFGNAEDLVCVKLHGLTFKKPTMPGDTLEIVAVPARTGVKSITIGAQVFINDDPEPSVHGFATFVTVDRGGKPYPHGLHLPDEWKQAHRELCEEAERQQAQPH